MLQYIQALKDLHHSGHAPIWLRGLVLVWHEIQFVAEPLLNPWLFIVLAGVMFFEWRMPTVRDQRRLSKGFRLDLFWFLGDRAVWLGALALLSRATASFYHSYLSFLTFDISSRVPLIVRIIFVLLLLDFLWWCVHYLKHRVWWLWIFHAVHHSQTEMNMFTDFRVHAGERALNLILLFIPLNMFDIGTTNVFYLAIVLDWYRVAYHANIRANYGPLKYVLVTPQSHRIHHSVEARHADTNFGSLFTFWDRLFGSQWANYDEYPMTGISDATFPLEQREGSTALGTWLRQTTHPVKQLFTRTQPSVETAGSVYTRAQTRDVMHKSGIGA